MSSSTRGPPAASTKGTVMLVLATAKVDSAPPSVGLRIYVTIPLITRPPAAARASGVPMDSTCRATTCSAVRDSAPAEAAPSAAHKRTGVMAALYTGPRRLLLDVQLIVDGERA